MKRFFSAFILFTLLVLAAVPAPADSLPLLDDFVLDISQPYDENDPSAGTFVYRCRYPHADEEAEGGSDVNAFYQELLEYTEGFTVPMLQDAFEGFDSSTDISYQVTCSNDDYFSVLIRNESVNPDRSRVIWEGHTFSRKNGRPGYTCALPHLLGILESTESDSWLQDRQTGKADTLLREMVWEMIEENENGIDFYPEYTEQNLSEDFFPEQDYYLDENGDPVFYLQPGTAAPESAGLLTFPIPLETILDEM